MHVQITVSGVREAEGDREEIGFTTQGGFAPLPEGGVITYEDPGEGMAGTVTTLTVTHEQVTIENRGALNSRLTVEPGKTHVCRYDTGCGILTMEITGNSLTNRLQEHPKTLSFTYTLSLGGGVSRHTMCLTLRPTIG